MLAAAADTGAGPAPTKAHGGAEAPSDPAIWDCTCRDAPVPCVAAEQLPLTAPAYTDNI